MGVLISPHNSRRGHLVSVASRVYIYILAAYSFLRYLRLYCVVIIIHAAIKLC